MTFGSKYEVAAFASNCSTRGLKKLKKIIQKRNKNAKYLDKELKSLYPNIILPERKKLFGNICFVYGEVQK